MDEAAKAAAQAVQYVDSELKLAALIAICVLVAFGLYLAKIAGDSKKLIEAKEVAEMERTKTRKAERDKQLGELQSRFNEEVTRTKNVVEMNTLKVTEVEQQINRHLDHHKDTENRTQTTWNNIDDRLRRIEGSMISRTDVEAKIEKVETEITKMNDRLSGKMDKVTDILNTLLGNIKVGSTHTKQLIDGGP